MMWRMMIAAALTVVTALPLSAQTADRRAADHARRVVDLLVAERFDEVASQFDAQVAAALPSSQLRDVWTNLRGQVGALSSIID